MDEMPLSEVPPITETPRVVQLFSPWRWKQRKSCVTLLAFVAVIVVYALSIGPAIVLAERGAIPTKLVTATYRPLTLTVKICPMPFREPFRDYIRPWIVKWNWYIDSSGGFKTVEEDEPPNSGKAFRCGGVSGGWEPSTPGLELEKRTGAAGESFGSPVSSE